MFHAKWWCLFGLSFVLAVVVLVVPGWTQAPAGKKAAKEWGKQIKNSIGMELVHIPPGKFMMGSPEKEFGRSGGEKQHDVQITKEFWLGIHAVTQKQFKDVMGYHLSYFSSDGKRKPGDKEFIYRVPAGGKDNVPADTSNFPVENVTWVEADEFCKKLTAMDGERGRKYRLPTEAEWEYSCRGNTPSYQIFHFGDTLSSKQANFLWGDYPDIGDDKGLSLRRTCKVGSYEKNRFGLYDMHGNVWEWCADWFESDYYAKSPAKDPLGPLEGAGRVIRGGCWSNDARNCRSAHRFRMTPTGRNFDIGFRVALVPPG